MRGGENTLKKSLIKLKKFEFSGYVKSIIKWEDVTSEGYLLIKNGMPVAAVYGRKERQIFFKKTESEKALKLIWVDSYDPNCIIEVRGRVDVDGFISQNPRSSISLIKFSTERKDTRARAGIKWGEKPQAEEPDTANMEKDLKEQIERWRKRGYIVKGLEESLDGPLERAEKIFEDYVDNLKRIEFFKDALDRMNTKGHKNEVKKIESMLKNPMKITAIEAAIEELSQEIQAKQSEISMVVKKPTKVIKTESPPGVYGEIIPTDGDIVDKCSVCGGDMKGEEKCPICGALKEDMKQKRLKYDIDMLLTARDTGLMPTMTFENFVVGDNNRFSQAAALAVSKSQSTVYNPLFICAESGLGKTHLLNAIGNFVIESFDDKIVLYVPTEKFIHEFSEASKTNKIKKFRDKYRKVDFLLLDDVEYFSGHDDAQEEFFHTFNSLRKYDKQVVMTCDQALKDIPDLKDKLVSKFESGLLTDIQNPNFETRMIILKQKVENENFDISHEVLLEIGKRYVASIRTLIAALNKVMAYCELTNNTPSMAIVNDVLKDELTEEIQIMQEEKLFQEETKADKLKVSHSYLIEENRPDKCFALFVDCLDLGFDGMAITRLNPKRIKEEYDFGSSDVYWLTDKESSDVKTILPGLERIIYKIEDMLNAGTKSVLLIDGLQYLISSNNFEAVLRFLRRLIDEISESNCIFLMGLTPETLEEQELKILEREMEVLSFK